MRNIKYVYINKYDGSIVIDSSIYSTVLNLETELLAEMKLTFSTSVGKTYHLNVWYEFVGEL